jgi:hypothetical protein
MKRQRSLLQQIFPAAGKLQTRVREFGELEEFFGRPFSENGILCCRQFEFPAAVF